MFRGGESERGVTGVDFNGHVGEGNSDKEILGRYGLRQMVVDFAKKAAVNMYFNKREAHRSHRNGGRYTHMNYLTQKVQSERERGND